MFLKSAVTAILLWASMCLSATVNFYTGESNELDERWNWAVRSMPSSAEKVWIGYSIPRQPDGHSRIGSWCDHKHHPTLYELLSITEPRLDVAFLFLTEKSGAISDVKCGTFDSEFDLQQLPLTWLGSVPQEKSVNWLQKKYAKVSREIHKDFVVVFGLHAVPASTQMLMDFVTNEREEIQKDAVFWLGQPGHADAFDFLQQTLNSHPRISVRKAAVFSISQSASDAAGDVIIKTARSNTNMEIRKEAIFWLGQLAAEQSTDTLKSIIYDEPTLELKKHAVFALSQVEDESVAENLIQIATTHPNAEVRKTAIFWLSETGSDKALDVLIGLLKD